MPCGRPGIAPGVAEVGVVAFIAVVPEWGAQRTGIRPRAMREPLASISNFRVLKQKSSLARLGCSAHRSPRRVHSAPHWIFLLATEQGSRRRGQPPISQPIPASPPSLPADLEPPAPAELAVLDVPDLPPDASEPLTPKPAVPFRKCRPRPRFHLRRGRSSHVSPPSLDARDEQHCDRAGPIAQRSVSQRTSSNARRRIERRNAPCCAGLGFSDLGPER